MQADWTYGHELAWFLQEVTGRLAGAPRAGAGDRILPSPTLTSDGRMDVYRRSYQARLEEALLSDHPALRRLLGGVGFSRMSRGYTAAFPPSSWTLDDLGRLLPVYFAYAGGPGKDAAPPDAAAGCRCGDDDGVVAWPPTPAQRRMLRDVARLEVVMAQVFGAPLRAPLTPDDLAAFGLERLAGARLVTQPSLRLLQLRHRASAIVTAARQELELPDLSASPTFVAVYRREYRVFRVDMPRFAFRLLQAIRRGMTVGDAVQHGAAEWEGPVDELAPAIQSWFAEWASDGLFTRILPPR